MLTTVVVRVRLIRKIVDAVVEIPITKNEFLRNGVKTVTITGGGREEKGDLVETGELEVEIEIDETENDGIERMIVIEIKTRTEKATEIEIETGNEKETEINLETEIVEEMTTEKIDVVLLRRKDSFTCQNEGKVTVTRMMMERLAKPWLIISIRMFTCFLIYAII